MLSAALLLAGCSLGDFALDGVGRGEPLSLETVVAGLREALEVGTGSAVKTVSRRGGYFQNAAIRIPMPAELEKPAATLRGIGLGSQVDAFEAKMNEAAEEAAKQAAPVFVGAIRQMTFDDARKILDGGDTAATDYFRGKTTEPLKGLYRPKVRGEMEKVGAVKAYNEMMKDYLKLPLVPKPKLDLDEYVTDRALAGLFDTVAGEERKIRRDPAARTTELLRKVFAKQ
jgi:hypothetical protein